MNSNKLIFSLIGLLVIGYVCVEFYSSSIPLSEVDLDYEVNELRYSVMMSGEPDEYEEKYVTEFADLVVIGHGKERLYDLQILMVSPIIFKVSNDLSAEFILQNLKDAAIQEYSGNIVEYSRVNYSSYPGIEIAMNMILDGEALFGYLRFYYIDSDFIMVGIIGQPDKITKKDAQRFWDTFKVDGNPVNSDSFEEYNNYEDFETDEYEPSGISFDSDDFMVEEEDIEKVETLDELPDELKKPELFYEEETEAEGNIVEVVISKEEILSLLKKTGRKLSRGASIVSLNEAEQFTLKLKSNQQLQAGRKLKLHYEEQEVIVIVDAIYADSFILASRGQRIRIRLKGK